jgi:hypothetical protein
MVIEQGRPSSRHSQRDTPIMEELGRLKALMADRDWSSVLLELSSLKERRARTGYERRAHLETLARVLAASEFTRLLTDMEREEFHAKLVEKNDRRSKSLLGALARAITPEREVNRTLAQHRHNRDVRALRYLQDRNVDPEQVVALGEAPGEGVDAWARVGAKKRLTTAADDTAELGETALEGQGRRDRVRIIWETEGGEARRKLRLRLTQTSLDQSEEADLEALRLAIKRRLTRLRRDAIIAAAETEADTVTTPPAKSSARPARRSRRA